MKYLKQFANEADYQAFKESEDYILPNVSSIVETKSVEFNPYVAPPAAVGDVAYWDGSNVQTCSLDTYNSSMGSAVGVVVIPKGFAPDGKIRICALKNTSSKACYWSTDSLDVIDSTYSSYKPGNYNAPMEQDGVEYTKSLSSPAYLSSDKFTGVQSQQDPLTYYASGKNSAYYIRPLYYNNAPNPLVYGENITANNLQDFNGKSYTDTLKRLHNPYGLPPIQYPAAYQASRYSDSTSDLQWYLPAIGELAHLMPRFNLINGTLSILGDTIGNVKLWSSTESSKSGATYLNVLDGSVDVAEKYTTSPSTYVRPFATID